MLGLTRGGPLKPVFWLEWEFRKNKAASPLSVANQPPRRLSNVSHLARGSAQ